MSTAAVVTEPKFPNLEKQYDRFETDEYVVFPRNYEPGGLDYKLNWSLNKNGVTPGGKAFRITKAAEAMKHAQPGTVVAGAKPAPEAGESALSFDAFEAVRNPTKRAFHYAPTLYVCEGDIPGSRVACRIITDSAEHAATSMCAVLERMPRPKDPKVLQVTCFATTSGADFEGFVIEQGDGAVYNSNELVADVVLTGKSFTPAKLAATLAAVVVELKK
jgi:hypothetical protein